MRGSQHVRGKRRTKAGGVGEPERALLQKSREEKVYVNTVWYNEDLIEGKDLSLRMLLY